MKKSSKKVVMKKNANEKSKPKKKGLNRIQKKLVKELGVMAAFDPRF